MALVDDVSRITRKAIYANIRKIFRVPYAIMRWRMKNCGKSGLRPLFPSFGGCYAP